MKRLPSSIGSFTSDPETDTRCWAHLPSPFIQTWSFRLSYGDKLVLDDVNLSIYKGRITALVGPSGCGKTSFLASLNRLTDLISGCRVSGEIHVDGMNVLSPQTDVIQLRRRIGMIFQKPNPFPFSIRRNLEFPLREHGLRRPDLIQHTVERTLKEVGLWDEVQDRLDSPALTLSGGQQQRLCIARALALSPEVLLMDEPCSALDPLSSGIVEDLITSLRERYTMLIVTHNLAQARRIADHAALFWVQNGTGRMIEYGPSEQFFESPRDPLTAAYVSGARG